MISDGAFSIFKRFIAREKPFHEMLVGRMDNFGGGGSIKDLWFKLYTFYISKVQIVQMFNVFKERSKGSGLDTPPASALDLRLKLGS